MFFSRDKDDDDDFIPNPNYHSNLASIFGGSGGGGENNSSLTYTPPKQPRKQNKPTTIATPPLSTSSSSSILCMKTVQTFKLVDSGANPRSWSSQGKLGAAIISFKSEDGTSYLILLYRDKENRLCTARIMREFNFQVHPKNYFTFYDKQNVMWSILFESPADMADFNLQVAKCRWKAENSTNPILIQDLWCPLPSGEASQSSATPGDSVELSYNLFPIENSLEDAGTGESQRVVVEVETLGWKQALVGVQLNTQRVIILQPLLVYGDLNPNEVVYSSPMVVKFTVLQVSKASQLEPPTKPPSEENRIRIKETTKPEPALTDEMDQNTGEGLQSPKTTKADLINRMARMGQALPFKKAVPTPSDSDETEEDHKSSMHRFSKVVPKPRARVHHQNTIPPVVTEGIEAREPSPLHPPVAVTPQVPIHWTPGVHPYMVGNMYPVPQVSSPLESHSQFNMFLSEVRTTNSELRMGLTRLTDKVETLQTKVEDSKKAPPPQDINSVLEKLMEGEQQLKDQLQQVLITLQNTQLASQSRESVECVARPPQSTHAATTSSVHTDTAQSTVRVSDCSSSLPCQQCAELHQSHVSLTEEMKKLLEENEFLQTSLTAQKDALQNAKVADKDQMSQIESLQRQLSDEQRNVSKLNNSLESLQRTEEILTNNLQTANNSIVELQNTLREKQTSIDKLEQALKDSEATKLEEVRRNLQEVLDPKPVIAEHIKKILNAVYKLVKVQFEPQRKYDANFIQSVLAETIKAVTLEHLQNGDLLSSAPVVPVQTMPEDRAQTRSDDLKTLYINRDQQSAHNIESQSSGVTSASEKSSQSSLVSQTHDAYNIKESVSDKLLSERKTNGLDEKGKAIDNSTSIDTPSSMVNSTDDSSDEAWRPQPPPPPLFEDEEIDDDWLNS